MLDWKHIYMCPAAHHWAGDKVLPGSEPSEEGPLSDRFILKARNLSVVYI